jgi:endonuclease/exonuclease/phosphatase family metal-dependent hydrolase
MTAPTEKTSREEGPTLILVEKRRAFADVLLILEFVLLLLALLPLGGSGSSGGSSCLPGEAEGEFIDRVGLSGNGGTGQHTPAHDLRLMTFNIRYGSADDGANSWPRRREAVAGIISGFDPDVLAIQEGLAFQLQELSDVLTGYRKLGQHREGASEGEFSGLFVKEARITVLDWGEFWLSQTPDSVASRGWDAALPRMAVWVEIEGVGGGGPVRVYGTHFDHQGETARRESARLMVRHARGGPPSVVMGDLNAGEDSDPLRVFFDMGYRSAFPTLHPESEQGTFNGFRDPSGGDRIDHILLAPGLEASQAEIPDGMVGGVWPSDHFPVTAVVEVR